MKTILILIKRNIKLFFKDKGMFFTALVAVNNRKETF